MKKIKLGTNFTVFILFFGVTTLEAFQTRNWVKAGFWLAIGLVFLLADNFKKKDAGVKRWNEHFLLSTISFNPELR